MTNSLSGNFIIEYNYFSFTKSFLHCLSFSYLSTFTAHCDYKDEWIFPETSFCAFLIHGWLFCRQSTGRERTRIYLFVFNDLT